MKRRSILLAVLVLVLVLSASIGTTMAYFTTYSKADGDIPVDLGDHTEIQEQFSQWTKHVTITSDEDSQPVFVRARAYGATGYTLTYSGAGWSNGGDGWYYCDAILYGGGSTATLDVLVGNVPESVEDGEHFNVIVVYETTPVRYQADGTPYADWAETLITSGGT